MYAEAEEGNEKQWVVGVTPPLSAVGEGRIMALLLGLEVPSGCRITEITCGEGSEGMRMTVSYEEEGRIARVLLDGIPRTGNSELLMISLKGKGSCGVSPVSADGNEAYLYCMREDGEIMTYPLVTKREEGSTPPELPTESVDTEANTDAVTNEDELPAEPLVYPVFVGCRESAPVGDRYSIRFLFDGGEGMTPVFCLAGQGNLTVETGREGKWSYCTFRGAFGEVRYVFGVMTQDGLVYVTYENGEFLGFTK